MPLIKYIGILHNVLNREENKISKEKKIIFFYVIKTILAQTLYD